MMPVTPAMPFLKVTFVYLEGGQEQRRYQMWCSAIPREGELVRPEAGSKRVIVHAVVHCVEQIGESGPALLPVVFLRDLTPDEESKYLFTVRG
jgi:hypothetical protein